MILETQSAARPRDSRRSAPAKRLTLRSVLHDLAERVFSLERGWLLTARQLSTQPGAMIRRYVGGERKRNANPFAYLLMGGAVNVVTQKLLGFQELYMDSQLDASTVSPRMLAFQHDANSLLMQHLPYVALGILIPFAVLLRLFFRRRDYNLAETMVFALYTGGHMALFSVVTLPLTALLRIHPLVVGLPISLAYMAWAALGFFGGRAGTVLKTWGAYLAGALAYATVAIIAIMVYVIYFLSPAYTGLDDWNLVSAAGQGRRATVESLLENGADVNLTEGRTALHAAAEHGHLDVVEQLLAHGADINAGDHLGRSSVFYAVRTGHRDIALHLLDAGADATLQSATGETLLIMVAKDEDTTLARRLLEAGCDVNAVHRKEDNEVTALMRAVRGDNPEMVELLLAHGAEPALGVRDGRKAADLARSKAIRDLIRAAADPPRTHDPQTDP